MLETLSVIIIKSPEDIKKLKRGEIRPLKTYEIEHLKSLANQSKDIK